MSKEFQYDTKKIGKLYPVIKPFTMAFIKFMYKVRAALRIFTLKQICAYGRRRADHLVNV